MKNILYEFILSIKFAFIAVGMIGIYIYIFKDSESVIVKVYLQIIEQLSENLW